MKTTRFLISSAFVLAWCAAGMTGCAVQQVYLQDLSADAPVLLPPVHVAVDSTAGTFSFSPRLTFNNKQAMTGRVDGHSLVSARGVYEVDSTVTPYRERSNANTLPFRGKNLTWNMPKFQAGLDMEYAVTNKFALTGFLEFSRIGETDFIGMGAGVALLFGQGTMGGRVEGGILLQDVASTSRYVVASSGVFSSTTDVYFRQEVRKDRCVDLYASLTINSRSPTSPVNGLLSIGLSGGTLASFSAHGPGGIGGDVAANTTILSVSPGLFADPWKGIRILGCVRVVVPLGVDDADPSSFIMPMAKVQFSF